MNPSHKLLSLMRRGKWSLQRRFFGNDLSRLFAASSAKDQNQQRSSANTSQTTDRSSSSYGSGSSQTLRGESTGSGNTNPYADSNQGLGLRGAAGDELNLEEAEERFEEELQHGDGGYGRKEIGDMTTGP